MILMNDFKGEDPKIRESMLSAVGRVLDSGWYVLGNEVIEFEKKWASTCGVGYAVGVGNGMDAIELTLRALDIGVGDEVITTPMTAFATVLAILRAGATPVLADIDPGTALMSIDSVKRCISPNTKAVLLVHLYGQVSQMDAWTSFCMEQKIFLIEDCAQAHLSTWRGKVAGSFGVAGAYSFYPTKNLGSPGDAGTIVTENQSIAERTAKLRNYGQSVRYHHPELGMNSRMDEIHAAMLLERLKWLPEFTHKRQLIAQEYYSKITNPHIKLLDKPVELNSHVYHLFVITTKNREALINHLKAFDVQSLIHYPICVHQQIPCANIARDPKGLSNSEFHASNCLSLPIHPQMSDLDVTQVIDSVNSFTGK